jgi:hypothetical protein
MGRAAKKVVLGITHNAVSVLCPLTSPGKVREVRSVPNLVFVRLSDVPQMQYLSVEIKRRAIFAVQSWPHTAKWRVDDSVHGLPDVAICVSA